MDTIMTKDLIPTHIGITLSTDSHFETYIMILHLKKSVYFSKMQKSYYEKSKQKGIYSTQLALRTKNFGYEKITR